MDPTENAGALLSISKVASDVATVIKSDLEALENTEGVPKALVNRLKRSVEASELASRKVPESSAKVGGSGFAYSQSRLDAEDRTVQRRLSMASGPKTPKAEKKALGDLTNFVTSYQKGESLSKKTKRDAVRPKTFMPHILGFCCCCGSRRTCWLTGGSVRPPCAPSRTRAVGCGPSPQCWTPSSAQPRTARSACSGQGRTRWLRNWSSPRRRPATRLRRSTTRRRSSRSPSGRAAPYRVACGRLKKSKLRGSSGRPSSTSEQAARAAVAVRRPSPSRTESPCRYFCCGAKRLP